MKKTVLKSVTSLEVGKCVLWIKPDFLIRKFKLLEYKVHITNILYIIILLDVGVLV